MEIKTRTKRGCTVIDLKGKLYLGSATRDLRNTINKVAEKNSGNIVVNMQNVTHMDSTGLGQLVSSCSHVKNLQRNLVLLNPQENTLKLLVITKLESVFDIFHDEALAVAGSANGNTVTVTETSKQQKGELLGN